MPIEILLKCQHCGKEAHLNWIPRKKPWNAIERAGFLMVEAAHPPTRDRFKWVYCKECKEHIPEVM